MAFIVLWDYIEFRLKKEEIEMDLSSIKPLKDFPETSYREDASALNLQFRWIHAQCFQFRLPGGKVLMTDPFFPQHPKAWTEEGTSHLDPDDIGRVDYVTVNHSHFDHVGNLPDVFRENTPIVICDRIYARELSAAYQIPEYYIYPIVPGMTYYFPDFKLETVQGKHNNLNTICDPEGKQYADPASPMIGPLNSFGCLFNTNYLFTLKNNFRIGFAAGVDVDSTAEVWKNTGPDIMLRQRMWYSRPEIYAEECRKLGGQLILPMHHDACNAENQDMNAFAEKVNKILSADGSWMNMFNPVRLKWYSINLQIKVES